MRVEQVMSRPVHFCHPEDSLAKAACLMWDHDCGCLPVVAEGAHRVAGMITDRDICMHALFENKPLAELQVKQAMATDVQVCRPYDELSVADEIMRGARLRRLPVLDDDGNLVGMVTLADLAREAQRETAMPERDISEKAVAHALAEICHQHHRDVAA
jgi:CBS domain-containing protein